MKRRNSIKEYHNDQRQYQQKQESQHIKNSAVKCFKDQGEETKEHL